MTKAYFITGTDTNVGKTTVCLALMKHFKEQGKRVACMKPVSAGCTLTTDGLRNDDAIRLLSESSIQLPYDLINPYAFEPAIAPHIAAQQSGATIDLNHIKTCYDEIASHADVVIIEGAGGWLVPINDSETMELIAIRLQLPIIMVVGMRLGCLNHALLTANNITENGFTLTGWIANHIDKNMEQQNENIRSLEKFIGAPLLGSIEFNNKPSKRQLKTHSDLPLMLSLKL